MGLFLLNLVIFGLNAYFYLTNFKEGDFFMAILHGIAMIATTIGMALSVEVWGRRRRG